MFHTGKEVTNLLLLLMVNMQFEVEITLDECSLCLVNVETHGMCYQYKNVYGG